MNENEIKKLEALKEKVTQFSDMWIIEMCDEAIAKLKEVIKNGQLNERNIRVRS